MLNKWISLLSTAFFLILLFTLVTAKGDDIPDIIPVNNFIPKPIRLKLEDLPEPYATDSETKPPKIKFRPNKPVLNVPPGFQVNIYAKGLDKPRWLALSPEGDVLVTETYKKRIRRLRDTDNDGMADEITLFADGNNRLNQPFGMALNRKYVYIANTNSILRFPYKKMQGQLQGAGKKIADLPGGGYNQHWTRNVILSPDEKYLYVSVGSRSNSDEENLPRASILRMRVDGSENKVLASGLRNTIGMEFHPRTRQLYAVVNERDGMGDDLVPDYFTHIQEKGFYGWPYAYLAPQNLDPRHVNAEGLSINPDMVEKTITPDVLFESHSAPMAMVFSKGNMFPEYYRNGAFVTMRGSWNRGQGTGYKLVFVPFTINNEPAGYYEDFLTGFLLKPSIPETWARPVGALFLPDGSLIFTDEENGRIFRVSYGG